MAISWYKIGGKEGTLLMLSNVRHAELCPVSSRGIRVEARFCLCTNRKWQPNNLAEKSQQKNAVVLRGVDEAIAAPVSLVKPTELPWLDFLAP